MQCMHAACIHAGTWRHVVVVGRLVDRRRETDKINCSQSPLFPVLNYYSDCAIYKILENAIAMPAPCPLPQSSPVYRIHDAGPGPTGPDCSMGVNSRAV